MFVILRSEYRILVRHKVKPDISLPFFFLTLFVFHHKPRLLPDSSVLPVVVHSASGQSYFSSTVTPILMNLRGEGTTRRRKQGSKDRKSEKKTILKEEDIKTRERQDKK